MLLLAYPVSAEARAPLSLMLMPISLACLRFGLLSCSTSTSAGLERDVYERPSGSSWRLQNGCSRQQRNSDHAGPHLMDAGE